MSGLARAEKRNWDAFWNKWNSVIRQVPDAKKRALAAAGAAIKKEVDKQIAGQGVHDFGRVQSWQEVRVGSKGGFVAITPKAENIRVSASGSPTTARKVTGYLEKGHQTRSGRASDYADEHGMVTYNETTGAAIVPGRHFYAMARLQAGNIGRAAGEQIMKEIQAGLEKETVS